MPLDVLVLPPSGRRLGALPKAHLHIHLDGAMRPATFFELAQRSGIRAKLPSSYGSFAAFTQTITAAAASLRTADDVHRLVLEVAQDAAADGAVWIEPSLWPGLFRGRLGADEAVVELVLSAAQVATAATGVGVGVVVAANRDRGPDAALALARIAARYRNQGVAGFGLDGNEANASAHLFHAAFAYARHAGLRSVPHAGELSGAGSVEAALDVLGADRIMHGVRAVENADLVRRLAAEGIVLDVCPTSNVLLSVADWSTHPLPSLLEAGVDCSLGADDPLLFDTSLLAEYHRARTYFGLSDAALAALARTSVHASSAPANVIVRADHGIDAWLTEVA